MSDKSPFLITHKIEQASCKSRGWGHPTKFEKKHTKIKIEEEKPTPPLSKVKRKKIRKPYVSPYDQCPFCKIELEIDNEAIDLAKKEGRYFFDWLDEWRKKECVNCKSYEVTECPACKRKTWYNPNTMLYKHKVAHCGFNGKRKEVQSFTG